MIVIRNFVPQDLSQIMYMASEAFNQDYGPGFYISLHNYWPDGFLVAKQNDEIIGFILGSITDKEEARVLIVTVNQHHRKKGTGSALLREFINNCGLRGIKRITLEIRESNDNAKRFFSKFGFQYVCELKKYYLDGEDGQQYLKFL